MVGEEKPGQIESAVLGIASALQFPVFKEWITAYFRPSAAIKAGQASLGAAAKNLAIAGFLVGVVTGIVALLSMSISGAAAGSMARGAAGGLVGGGVGFAGGLVALVVMAVLFPIIYVIGGLIGWRGRVLRRDQLEGRAAPIDDGIPGALPDPPDDRRK